MDDQHEDFEDWQPEFDDGFAADLIGKYVLVGVRVEDRRGVVRRDEQFHGTVLSVDRKTGITIALRGRRKGETETVPPATNVWHPAEPGVYRLRSTDEEVVDPDFTSTWHLVQPDA